MTSCPSDWIGSVYLFIQSDSINLPQQYDLYKSIVYNALRNNISEFSGGSPNYIDILKISKSDQELILHLKFYGKLASERFLQGYREKRVHQHIQNQLCQCLKMEALQVHLELRVGTEKLDTQLDEEEKCLQYIFSLKPCYQKDDELADLERCFMNVSLETLPLQQNSNVPPSSSPQNSNKGSPPHTLRSLSSEGSTFQFQDQEFIDRPLTSEHHQIFAKFVGTSWKKVGRTLKENCPALEDPAIETLAYEYGRESLYEQAYQMLQRFIDCEGKKGTLQRLVDALVRNGLTGIAEKLLSVHENGLN
ncbi:tumor necrosis factor receptor type 1-associated DEATH domain protein [Bufo gargarizans]|uniref:tumor necrosis factor receptor type 1-associated DEATH domain protein n=1 Tax=Bufo gargarizans TaxID=30331 RepID=UPI001CF39592|nr:tumor necrosis factor receptor type 1-associated DEATH domain protein [Bufo gargarizans]XP_044125832.1 tumor necrosis factor receptor type 1-associated DEATH domain protein [Bufo gargarizans]XP_044125833.1 tumor necrosis factor receptor type 1-associated DEATH domain protein [Bufo gargarizans]